MKKALEISYEKGPQTLSRCCHAWLAPDGTWGWSNAGLITGRKEAMLIDTLFDVPLTREMVDGFRSLSNVKEVQTVFNTHANGDHWFGNQIFVGSEIIASSATADEMAHDDPNRLLTLMEQPGPLGRFAKDIFRPFNFKSILPTRPTRTFEKELTVDVGGVEVLLLNLGPAHTAGDSIAFVPEEGVLYAGDLLFVGGTPISWAGPITNWVAACDYMISLKPDLVVPGHGRIIDVGGIREVRDYLSWIYDEASDRFRRGMTPEEAVRDIDLGPYGELNESGRIAQNVLAVYYELDPDYPKVDVAEVFRRIAEFEGYTEEGA
jgi:cyclase